MSVEEDEWEVFIYYPLRGEADLGELLTFPFSEWVDIYPSRLIPFLGILIACLKKSISIGRYKIYPEPI
jgi:hypothetical protein